VQVFLVLWGIGASVLLILASIMPFCGYLGARGFRVPLLVVYVVFLVLQLALRVATIFTPTLSRSRSDTAWWKVFAVLSAILTVSLAANRKSVCAAAAVALCA
jgi:hypothetical protein